MGANIPNAKYVVSRREYEHWDPEQGAASGWGQDGVFADSILPCAQAGQIVLVDDGHELDGGFRVEAAPGHTVGNVVIRATGRGATGVFSGDTFHSPLQIAFPEMCTVACEDPAQAIRSRRAILDDCAAHGHLVLPAYFTRPHVGRVRGTGQGYEFLPGLGAA